MSHMVNTQCDDVISVVPQPTTRIIKPSHLILVYTIIVCYRKLKAHSGNRLLYCKCSEHLSDCDESSKSIEALTTTRTISVCDINVFLSVQIPKGITLKGIQLFLQLMCQLLILRVSPITLQI